MGVLICAGVVFVLGSALGSPGGATLMLQLVNHLRRQGFFVSVALTRPFGFEGVRKLEQADALIEAMEEVAHLVVRSTANSGSNSEGHGQVSFARRGGPDCTIVLLSLQKTMNG